MGTISTADRKIGALLGAFIGDALALGPHWYYDLDEQRRDYGDWIDGYTAPQEGRYHEGHDPGDNSQAGYILKLLVKSLVDQGRYEHEHFCEALERDLFSQIDGSPKSGPGGYTSQSIREAWKRRVKEGKDWSETGGNADTTEAIERVLALAIIHSDDLNAMANSVLRNSAVTQTDDTILSLTLAYSSVLSLLIQGHSLDEEISGKLMKLVKKGDLPFHAVTTDNLAPPKPGQDVQDRLSNFASPDALLSPSYMAEAAADPGISIEPAWKASIVYGMPCAAYHQLPSAYYLSSRFKDDFESAVLHAVNGGGQNQARAILTGALVGAQVGVQGIPARFIEGLTESVELQRLAKKLAEI